jgi:hypothetical protein
MVKVSTDPDLKLIEAVLTGFVKVEDAVQVSNQIKKAMMSFGPQQAILLIDLVGFAPMTKDVLPLMRGMGRDVVSFFRKAALIQDFSMDLQGRKIIEPPPGVKLPSYTTREKAMEYLTAE